MKLTTVVLLGLIGLGAPLAAQELRGVVVEQVSREPVRGAVLTLLDSAGAVMGRVLSNERGEYRVNWTRRMRRMRVVRLGFRPNEVAVAEPADASSRLDVPMTRVTTFLEQIRVTAKSCPRRSSRGSAVALFEQAKAALLATIVARDANPATLVRLAYERTMDGTSDRIKHQSVRIDSASRARASFSAVRDADAFVRRGFMEDYAGEHMFFAPDADVLLDDRFANGYCFRVMDPVRERPNQVGLGFYAPDRRAERVDVDGALWIDTIARTLRDIEFRYVGIDPVLEAYGPGGRIMFREMSNGVVMVDRWNLRLMGATAESFDRPDGSRTVLPRFYATETGGEVASARWRPGPDWKASLGTFSASATKRDNSPARGARLQFVDTPYRLTVDSTGRFEIKELLPGPYQIVALDPRLDSIGVTIPTLSFTAARDSVERRTFVVRNAEEFVADRCIADERYASTDSLVLVRVMTGEDQPVAGARLDLEVTPNADLANMGQFRMGTGGSSALVVREGAVTGTDGLVAVCSGLIRRGTTLKLRIRYGRWDKVVFQKVDQRLTIMKVIVDQ